MAALLCTNTAAVALPRLPRRRAPPCDVALTAPVPARLSLRRRGLPTTGLRCAGTEVGVTDAIRVAAAAPFGHSLVAVDSAGDDEAANKVTFLLCTRLACCIASKLGFKETAMYVIYATGAFFAGWLLSAVVSAIDSIPLLPRILEMVGLGYTVWFSSRYLLFKKNREELFAKAYDLKMRIVGSGDA
uniref:Cyanobacterial aminoacyl-tRNA synthetase CAAD domain-containing protein n=1 Tax=Aegilops tauschii TaxID=37682 RepID=R7WA06_AEGTA